MLHAMQKNLKCIGCSMCDYSKRSVLWYISDLDEVSGFGDVKGGDVSGLESNQVSERFCSSPQLNS